MKKYLSIGCTCLLTALLAFISMKRYALASVRYFDPDEFMYVNWAYHVFSGYIPYKDFMMIASPLYVVFLAPLFLIYKGIDAIAAARIVSFLLSIFLAGAVSFTYVSMHKSSWIAIIPAIILLILPMPSDKLLEIRPDVLSLLLFLFGLREVLLYKNNPSKSTRLFWAGWWLATSLLVLQKTGILVATVSFIVILSALATRRLQAVFKFIYGLCLPLGLFALFALFTNEARTVFYSVTLLARESIIGVARFSTLGWTFFFLPNGTYYGEPGLSLGLIVNHALWVLAIILAIATILVFLYKRQKGWYIRIIPALLLLISVIQYLFISPLKFSQYLLPASVFVAWFIAEWIELLFRLCSRTYAKQLLCTVFFILFCVLILHVFLRVHRPKFYWTNDGTYQKISHILSTIPRTEYIFDLEGRTIYYPYPYYACCLPIGNFTSLLFQAHLPIRDALQSTKTRYIYQAELPRIRSLSREDQAFIFANYEPQENGDLFVAKYW